MTVSHLLDVHRYVDDFNDAVMDAYESDTQEEVLGADACAARSIDGRASPEIRATQEERLANWHVLQELAGSRGREVTR